MKMTKATFTKMVWDLAETVIAKQEALDNAENADSPNEERVEKLQEELEMLEEMIEIVQNYIDL